MNSPVVVKIGGSLLASLAPDRLLAEAARHAAIVVPGGGPFADAVRAVQAEQGFSDSAAHAMAILAMEQTAFLLADRAPRFSLCTTREEISRLAGRPAIWRPAAMAVDADVPRDWSVSSDSLALWLAIAIAAPRLVLVKSMAVLRGGPQKWADEGIVDPFFPTLASRYSGSIACVGPDDLVDALASSARAAA